MSYSDANNDLLADILAESEPSGFREELLNATLRKVRRRRRVRQSRWAIGVAAMAVALAIINSRRSSEYALRAAAQSCTVVATHPLAPSAVISTKPFDRHRWVVSISGVAVVHTGSFGAGIHLLSDRELLAFAGGDHPAVLIRLGPRSQQLVFARPEDQNKFLRP